MKKQKLKSGKAEMLKGDEVLLTPEEIGEVFQVTGRTVREWFHAGLIPAEVAAGRVFRFDLERVREALAANAEKVRGCRVSEFAEVF